MTEHRDYLISVARRNFTRAKEAIREHKRGFTSLPSADPSRPCETALEYLKRALDFRRQERKHLYEK